MIIKKLVQPFQKVLLSRNLCVGCTHPLPKTRKIMKIGDTKTMYQCKCKRRYIYDSVLGNYKRATFEDEVLFISLKK